MFRKVLIANRGEAALRILRACHDLEIRTVAIHSTADSDAMHVRLADESVCIGPPDVQSSYLNVPAIITAAHVSGVDALHPGYGFLSENADFAQIVALHDITFIGPKAEHISVMGDKVEARRRMRALGVPVVPGAEGALSSLEELRALAAEIGFPLIVKAAAGGGGRGMKVVQSAGELEGAWQLARAEALAGFGDDTVYAERYLATPRHVEFQILADAHGNVMQLGERDCSIQRRHQKMVEEAPSPAIDADARRRVGDTIVAAVRKLGYLGLGTVEMLYDDGEFYFIEMNTRLQVEHPVTEMVTGIDLVCEQLRVAAGEPVSFKPDSFTVTGHAIECRITAEDPETLTPQPGRAEVYHAPSGPGVRVDSAMFGGSEVSPHYDSLIAKLIVHGRDRDEALRRLRRALREYAIDGLANTIPLHQRILEHPDFAAGQYDVHWLERELMSREHP